MGFQDLLQAGLIRPVRADPEEIRARFQVATRDAELAEGLLSTDLDWALIVAYNAMLQACTASMFAQGFRPRGTDHHRTVIRFIRSTRPDLEDMIRRLDGLRRRRHRAVYEVVGSVSASDAKRAVAMASRLIAALGGRSKE
ncbi:MAG: HEPN domain-containing protein [Coriobacteriia bacterium]